MTDPVEIDKLRMLIPHWIEHFEGHAAEFRRWVTKLDQADDILVAVDQIEAANEALEAALEKLGGALEIEHHPHEKT
jgi:hypothetical protein